MNFGFNPPDPDDVLKSMERLKDIFDKAANADTGSAQPLFQKLRDGFNKAADDALRLQNSGAEIDPRQAMMQMMPALMQIKSTVVRIQQAARSNPAAAEALQEMMSDMRAEISSLMGGMPGFPGAGPSTPPKPPAPPAPPKGPAPKPRGPGRGGTYDL